MKSPLGLFAIATLFHCFACSSATDGDLSPGSTAGAAGATNSGGATAGGVGGMHAGASGGGAANGGTASGGAPPQGGAGGTSSAGAAAAGTAGVATAGSGSGGAGAGGTGAGGTGAGGAGPVDGPGLFMANCQVCHGAQGVGGPLAPEIQHPVRDYAAWVVRNGRPGTGFPGAMVPFATSKLSDAQLKLIWDYLDMPPQPTTGQTLYHDYCANCHGDNGKGGSTGRAITGELAKLKSQVRSGAGLNQIGTRKNYMPAFPTSRLSDADVNLIYTYVGTL